MIYVCFFFNLEFFLQGGQQCWALWAFLAACPCTLFVDSISLFINWANKDACLHMLSECFLYPGFHFDETDVCADAASRVPPSFTYDTSWQLSVV